MTSSLDAVLTKELNIQSKLCSRSVQHTKLTVNRCLFLFCVCPALINEQYLAQVLENDHLCDCLNIFYMLPIP